MPQLLKWIASKLNRHEIPREGGGLYMVRYHTGESHQTAWWFLHNILLADRDAHHNHPYEWQISFILWSSYVEEVLDTRTGKITTRTRRWFNWIPRSKYHKVIKLNGDVWTLFIHGKKHGTSWGFWEPGYGHIHNKEYKLHSINMRINPIYWNNGWYWNDEIGMNTGPYKTRAEAAAVSAEYCKLFL